MPEPMASQVTIYLNEADRWHGKPLHLAILNYLHAENVFAACVLHAVGGFLGRQRVKTSHLVDAAKILGVSWREALDIPDGRVENTWENRLKVARIIRRTRPRVVILPYWKGRHPDHYTASKLGYEACFLAGLAKLDIEKALKNQETT